MVEETAMGTSAWYVPEYHDADARLLHPAGKLRRFHCEGSFGRVGQQARWTSSWCEGEVEGYLMLQFCTEVVVPQVLESRWTAPFEGSLQDLNINKARQTRSVKFPFRIRFDSTRTQRLMSLPKSSSENNIVSVVFTQSDLCVRLVSN